MAQTERVLNIRPIERKEGAMNTVLTWTKSHRALTALAIGTFLTIFVIFPTFMSVRNTGYSYETQLSAQYLDNQNYLSEYISGFYEQVSIAQAQSQTLDAILLDAVKGRYDEGGFSVGSSIFTAIVEAYPEAGVAELMENWGKIQDYIAAKREGYRNVQSKLLDLMRQYDTWRRTGIKSLFLTGWMFPSGNLEARFSDTVLTGDAAREKMLQLVLTSQARDAYETGDLDPLGVPSPAA